MNPKKSFKTLPREAYYSQSWFDKEQRLIFEKTWQFAGFEEDLQYPGEYITVQCGNISLIVIKDHDQKLLAVHNLCRHRGMQLLKESGKIENTITCPYHNWKYKINGQLNSLPFKSKEFPEHDLDKICLHKASIAIWRNMIWVHPNPEATPFSEWINGCEEYLGPHLPEKLIEYPESIYIETIKANWKIIAENFMDVYHLSQLHANTLNMYDHNKANFKSVKEHYMFWEPLSEKYREHLDELIPYKKIKEVTEDYLGAYTPWFFPNFGLSESESSWSTFLLIPINSETTKIIVRTKIEKVNAREYYSQQKKSYNNWYKIMGDKSKKTYENDPLLSGDFMKEDIYVCEQLQKSVKNVLYNPTFSKQMEMGIKSFQHNVLKWLNK